MDSRIRAIYKIEPKPQGAAQARRIIAEELAPRLPRPVVEDVKLMVSELVTNGIVHGAAEGDAPVMLDLCLNGHLRCRVLDHGQGFAQRTTQVDGPGGWGLKVVEQLADRWGMLCSPRRTEVWFERGLT
jgi:anti-sigma regulatory factor (Ser/Thr protein kinase)